MSLPQKRGPHRRVRAKAKSDKTKSFVVSVSHHARLRKPNLGRSWWYTRHMAPRKEDICHW